MHAAQTAWVEEIDAKLRVHQRLPHMLAGAYHGPGSKSVEEARRWAATSLETYDAQADKTKHHRVSAQLLQPGSLTRSQLEDFANGKSDMSSLPDLAVEFRCMALCPLVERKIEQPHIIINQTCKRSQGLQQSKPHT